MAEREKRMRACKIETRDIDGKRFYVGSAVVYNSRSEPINGYFIEKFAPGAFRDHLQTNPDIIATVDHDLNRMVGRTSAGTLRLTDTDESLNVECDRSEVTAGRDLAIYLERGEIRGMSFMFETVDDEWSFDEQEKIRLRTVKKARIYEVTFGTFPCYPATEADMRANIEKILPPGFRADRELLDLLEREI
jgi:HK97 family phage prohead protease